MMAVAHMCAAIALSADVKADIPSPDGKTVVSVIEREGQVYYQVEHDGKRFIHSSRLGLRTNAFDFSLLEFVTSDFERIQGTYSMDRSEAVRASENLVFSQYECDQEAQAACLHPFIRNTVGSMEFGGCFLNERLSRGNNRGTTRRTTDVFQISTLVLYQNAVQMLAIAPNNLTDAPQLCLDFIKEVPTTWDETRYIAGFPGENVVVARRNGDKWYVAAVNAVEQPFEIKVKDILEKLGVEDAPVRLIDGGNEPVESAVKASRKVSVAKNDAAILVIG